jgi:hypothetical protein
MDLFWPEKEIGVMGNLGLVTMSKREGTAAAGAGIEEVFGESKEEDGPAGDIGWVEV